MDTSLYKSFFSLLLIVFSLGIFGQSKEKLQEQKTRLEDEIKLANVILREMRDDKKESLSSLEALNQKLRIREQLIRTLSKEIIMLQEEAEAQEVRYNELQEHLALQQQVYADMIRKAYAQRSNTTLMMFILSSRDIFQAAKRIQYLKQIARARQQQIERIKETQALIVKQKEDILRKQEEKSRVIERQKNEKESLQSEKKQQEEQLASFKGKEKEIESDIKKKQQERDQLNREIERMIAAEIKKAKQEAERRSLEKDAQSIGLEKGRDFTAKTSNAVLRNLIDKKRKEREAAGEKAPEESLPSLTVESQQLAANFSANQKKLPWPVERGLVINRFGRQNHPVAKQVVIDNKGIDIATQKGSDAKAVFEGEVTRIVRIPGANKAVLVSHGNYFTVYSNLTDLYVSKGDKVKTGQKLGKIYSDDESGKTQLHFEIWRDMEVLDPQAWLQ